MRSAITARYSVAIRRLLRGDRSQYLTITERSLRLGHRNYAEEPYRFTEPVRHRFKCCCQRAEVENGGV